MTISAGAEPEGGPRLIAAFVALNLRARLGAAFASGVIMAAAQPPVGFWPALFLAGPCLFWLWRSSPLRLTFWVGWAAGAGFFSAALHWIIEPFLVDAAAHGWMAPFALSLMAGGLALFWGAAFWAAARLHARLGAPGAVRAAAMLALCWAGAEFARSFVLTGFPWALPAYAWTDAAPAQAASVIGPYGLSLLTLFAAVVFGAGLGGAGRARFAPAAVTALALASVWIWGEVRLSGEMAASGPLVRIVQTNVPQAEKWLPENRRSGFDRLLALSQTPVETGAEAAAAPAIVIWPEAAVTFAIGREEEARDEIARTLGGATLALGSLRLDDAASTVTRRSWRNSFFMVGPDAALSAPFDKIHLVPFGEYMPFGAWLATLGISSLAQVTQGIDPGEAHVVMRPAGAPAFAPLICYEMIFPRETARAASGVDWMVLVTNDAWFGDWAGPAQHLAKAQMRAIETGLPIARSANAGLSAMIDPFGRPLGAIGLGRAGVVDSRLPDSLTPPPYLKYGESFNALTVCIVALIATMSKRRSRMR